MILVSGDECLACRGKCRRLRALRSNLVLLRSKSGNTFAAGLHSQLGCLVVVYGHGRVYAYDQAGEAELRGLLAASTPSAFIKEHLAGTCREIESLQSNLLDETCCYCEFCDQVIDAPEEGPMGRLVCEGGHALWDDQAVERCEECHGAFLA